jgi:peptidoglycan hydrolase-like protein with peptidoglycan-binding domain
VVVGNIRKLSTEIQNRHQADIWCAHAETLIFRAHEQDRKDLFKAALAVFLQVLKLSPGHARALSGLAYLELGMGDTANALRLVNEALNSQAADPQIVFIQELLREELNQQHKAERIRQQSEKSLHKQETGQRNSSQAKQSSLSELSQALEGSLADRLVSEFSLNACHFDHAAELRLLQKILIQEGFLQTLSGKFDASTSRALKQFQSKEQLPVTGKTDRETRAKLNMIRVKQTVLQDLKKSFSAWFLSTGFREPWQMDYLNAALDHALPVLALSLAKHENTSPRTLALPLVSDANSPLLKACLEAFNRTCLGQEPDSDTLLQSLLPFENRSFLHICPELGAASQTGKISQGPAIKMLQLLLQKIGIPLKLSAQFDLHTAQALARFQQKMRLPAKGSLDQQSLIQLNQTLEKLI